ncbi:Rpn family recombination-promoting nuclease/putative transposase, partial [Arsenophonus nasoniae]
HKRIALLELLQKHIRRRDMTDLLDSIVNLLSYNYYTDNQVITMFNYLIQEGNAEQPAKLIKEIARQTQKHEGTLMNIAQGIREEGIRQGMQQGKIEGEKQASMKIARQMFESGMDRQSVMKFTGLTDAEMSNLFKD